MLRLRHCRMVASIFDASVCHVRIAVRLEEIEIPSVEFPIVMLVLIRVPGLEGS
jgi:hypothetical protein